MRNVNYYEILGITENATVDEIRSAFKVKVKEYHPDKVAHLGEELKYHANRRFILINEAKAVLFDEKNRKEYDQNLNNLRSESFELKCIECGYPNLIPKNINRKNIVCRQCGTLIANESYEQNQSVKDLASLMAASVLTLRNMLYTKFPDLSLVIDIGGLQIDIRKQEKSKRPEEIYATVNNKALHSYLVEKLKYQGEEWDEDFGVGWIFLPSGSDFTTAEFLIKNFIFYSNSSAPLQIRFEPFSIYNPGWSYWASVFILTSLFKLAPWQAAEYLMLNNGNLTNILDSHKIADDWMKNLKQNWKIYLMVSKLDVNSESEKKYKNKMNEILKDLSLLENSIVNIKNKLS